MKSDIHPLYSAIEVTCNCGHTFKTASTLCKNLSIEVCNKCHSFFTGKQKIVAAGRVETFMQKFGGYTLPQQN